MLANVHVYNIATQTHTYARCQVFLRVRVSNLCGSRTAMLCHTSRRTLFTNHNLIVAVLACASTFPSTHADGQSSSVRDTVPDSRTLLLRAKYGNYGRSPGSPPRRRNMRLPDAGRRAADDGREKHVTYTLTQSDSGAGNRTRSRPVPPAQRWHAFAS